MFQGHTIVADCIRTTKRRGGTLSALVAIAVSAAATVLVSPAVANAESASAATQTQRMTEPNLGSHQDGWYNAGQTLTLVCWTHGQPVKGHFSFNIPGEYDDLWYRVSDGRYVADVDIETGTLNAVGPDCAAVDQPQQQSAPAGQTVQGQIACLNSEPVGLWVQGESSTSGWGTVGGANPARDGMSALSTRDYSFTLDRGGRYQVHVGCGTKPFSDEWANNVKSDYVSGSHDFACNDMNFVTDQAWKAIRARIFGGFGRAINLQKNAPPFGRCEAV